MHSLEEVGREADTVRSEIEQLYVRGLASSTPQERKRLSDLALEWERLGAGHVAERLLSAMKKADADAKDAPQALLSAYTSLHVFERVLSLEAAAEAWTGYLQSRQAAEEGEGEEGDEGEGTSRKALSEQAASADNASPKPAAAPPIEDPKGALSLLDELSRAVEDLVRTGLTSATQSTREKLDASFKEASRRKLLRLGASLRYVNEEVGRFLADDGSFSIRRFSFFLHRSWVLARGMVKGIRDKDDRVLSALLAGGGATPRPVPFVDVVTLGVLKRTLANAYTFDFKLRIVDAKSPDLVGRSLTYSLVFPRKKDGGDRLPAEANLHLPQPQKFTPRILHQGSVVRVPECAVAFDERGAGRLMLGPKSTMTEVAPFSAWESLYRFEAEALLGRVKQARPGPLDLAVEMQEEIFVEGGELSRSPIRAGEGRRIFGLTGAHGLSLDVVIPDGPDGDDLLPKLEEGLKKKDKPIVYGLVYYEFGRTMFLPLSFVRVGPAPASEPATEEKAPSKKKGGKDASSVKPGGGKDASSKPAAAKGTSAKAAPTPAPDLITLSQKSFNVSALVGKLNF